MKYGELIQFEPTLERYPVAGCPQVAESAAGIGGNFKVIRTELGFTTMDLREFVCSQREEALSQWGITFEFPPRDKIPNNKGVFEEILTQNRLVKNRELVDVVVKRWFAEKATWYKVLYFQP